MNRTFLPRVLLSFFAVAQWACLPLLHAQGDPTYTTVHVTDELTVDGATIGDVASFNEVQAGSIVVDDDLMVYGDMITLGTYAPYPILPLSSISIEDNTMGAAFVKWKVGYWGASWEWITQSPWGEVTWMALSIDGALNLYDINAGNEVSRIKLNPYGTSSFTYNLHLDGADNRASYQTITGAGSILTVGLADARYQEKGPIYYLDQNSNGVLDSTSVVGQMHVVVDSTTPTGAVFSVKDGSVDPGNPLTKMYVTKAGHLHTDGEISSNSLVTSDIEATYIYSDEEMRTGVFTGQFLRLGTGNDGFERNVLGSFAINETTTTGVDIPVVTIGAGANSSSTSKANAMVVRKGGDVDVAGALRVPPAGDLQMGAFTSGRDPREALDPNEILPSAGWGGE